MRKLYSIIALIALLVVSCSKDNDKEFVFDKTFGDINKVANILNGKFLGEQITSGEGWNKKCEITFTPYSTPIIEEWENSGVVSRVKIFGECDVLEYYSDHLLETKEHWRYSVEDKFNDNSFLLKFYPKLIGKTVSRDIKIKDITSFEYNGMLFVKQK